MSQIKQLWVIPERRESFTSRSAEVKKDESYSQREFALYFLVSLFSCFDHFIGVFYYLLGRSMLSCYHGVHGQPRRAFSFFVVVNFFFQIIIIYVTVFDV